MVTKINIEEIEKRIQRGIEGHKAERDALDQARQTAERNLHELEKALDDAISEGNETSVMALLVRQKIARRGAEQAAIRADAPERAVFTAKENNAILHDIGRYYGENAIPLYEELGKSVSRCCDIAKEITALCQKCNHLVDTMTDKLPSGYRDAGYENRQFRRFVHNKYVRDSFTNAEYVCGQIGYMIDEARKEIGN